MPFLLNGGPQELLLIDYFFLFIYLLHFSFYLWSFQFISFDPFLPFVSFMLFTGHIFFQLMVLQHPKFVLQSSYPPFHSTLSLSLQFYVHPVFFLSSYCLSSLTFESHLPNDHQSIKYNLPLPQAGFHAHCPHNGACV